MNPPVLLPKFFVVLRTEHVLLSVEVHRIGIPGGRIVAVELFDRFVLETVKGRAKPTCVGPNHWVGRAHNRELLRAEVKPHTKERRDAGATPTIGFLRERKRDNTEREERLSRRSAWQSSLR
jgi:hypothetical protein